MNGSTRTREEAMDTLVVDCPWCAAAASVALVGSDDAAPARFTCSACSIDVELAPDPPFTLVVRAA